MNNTEFLNLFGFIEYKFSKEHFVPLTTGAKYNYINYIKKGNAEIIGDDFHINLNEGDILFIPKGSIHTSHWYGDPYVLYDSFSFLNYPSADSETYIAQKITPNEKMLELIEQIPTDNDVNCQSVGNFFLLLHEIFKKIERRNKTRNQLLLEKVMHEIRISQAKTMPAVAKTCGISTTALYMLFNTYLNCTPSQYKLAAKLEQAMYYLTTTDMSIEKISDKCGFSSSSYFRKVFYKQYNKTPREARKKALY